MAYHRQHGHRCVSVHHLHGLEKGRWLRPALGKGVPVQAGWSRELGIDVEGLIPERQLRMVSVVVGDDVITLHYRISPALPARDPDTGRPPWLTWDWHGVD